MVKIIIENGSKTITFELTNENLLKFIDETKECISNPQNKPLIMVNETMMGSLFLSNSVITIKQK